MSENVSFIDLNYLYKMIKKQCVVKFFNSAGLIGADIFPRINNLCYTLLNKSAQSTVRNGLQKMENTINCSSYSVTKFGLKDCECLDNDVVDDAIISSYFSFWDFGCIEKEYYSEEKYLISNKRASLTDWKKDGNPYSELHKLSSQYRQENIGSQDIYYILIQVQALLEQELSPQDMLAALRVRLAGYPKLLAEYFL